VMIDTLLAHLPHARSLQVSCRYALGRGEYALLTLHRPSNVDDDVAFDRLLSALTCVSEDLPVVFPVHPRTRPAIARSARATALIRDGQLRLLDPLGYVEFLGLMADSAAVLTDSGGVQEETTALGIPCLTMRENTERPITIVRGTNRLVGTDPGNIVQAWREVRSQYGAAPIPPLWDGHAARRIVDVLRREAGAWLPDADVALEGAHQ
jgi:UDP-N-acetylglucosamine 2-epimerase (non-hydrolysing)